MDLGMKWLIKKQLPKKNISKVIVSSRMTSF